MLAVVAADGDGRFVVWLINAMQTAHYLDVMRNDPTQENGPRLAPPGVDARGP